MNGMGGMIAVGKGVWTAVAGAGHGLVLIEALILLGLCPQAPL